MEIEDGVRGFVVEADLDEDITAAQLAAVLEAMDAAGPELATLSLGWGELPEDTSPLDGRDLIDLAYGTLPATPRPWPPLRRSPPPPPSTGGGPCTPPWTGPRPARPPRSIATCQ